MPSFKHILFPVDFSTQNGGIALYVACMARRYKARVSMLHAFETSAGAYSMWPAEAAVLDFQSMAAERKQSLRAFLQTEFQDVEVSRLFCEGDPARVICEYAANEEVDLIMMPTHGYGPFRRFLLGSVTAKVLHDATRPVWTSAHVPDAPEPPAGYRNVLCAVDLTPQSVPLVKWASEFARDHHATLKLVHAVPGASQAAVFDIEGSRFRTFLLDAAGEELDRLQSEAGTSVQAVLRGGDVAPVVRQAAIENQADLVIVGRGVLHEPFGRMRTHVYSIIREAPCPVISV